MSNLLLELVTFVKAYAALKKWYTEVEIEDLETVRQKYYDMKMSQTEQPSMFIMKMKKIQRDLKEQDYEVSDDDLVKRIFKVLPMNDEGVGPYDAKKTELMAALEKEILANVDADNRKITIDFVAKELEKIWLEKDLGNKAITDDGEKGFYAGTNKGRCYNCGVMGHFSQDNVSDIGTKNVNKEVYETIAPMILSSRMKEEC